MSGVDCDRSICVVGVPQTWNDYDLFLCFQQYGAQQAVIPCFCVGIVTFENPGQMEMLLKSEEIQEWIVQLDTGALHHGQLKRIYPNQTLLEIAGFTACPPGEMYTGPQALSMQDESSGQRMQYQVVCVPQMPMAPCEYPGQQSLSQILGLQSKTNTENFRHWGRFDRPEGKSKGRGRGKGFSRWSDTEERMQDIYENNSFLGKVCALSRDQAGSRMLQKKLEDGNPQIVHAIFSEVVNHVADLMTDPFGNYICQKVAEVCTRRHMDILLDKVLPNLVKISLNTHGTRAVQKLVEIATRPENTVHIRRLADSMRDSVDTMVKDLNGSHVIQCCLNNMQPQHTEFIYTSMLKNCVSVATHRHGCVILQRCLDSASPEQREDLMGAVVENVYALSQDPFGNYVVQYVIDLDDEKSNSYVITCLIDNIFVLAKHKFSSNVLEKCLQIANMEQRRRMTEELAKPAVLTALIYNPYANYVIQRALAVAPEPQFSALINQLKPLIPKLRESMAGKRIAQKLIKRYDQLSTDDGYFQQTDTVPYPQRQQAGMGYEGNVYMGRKKQERNYNLRSHFRA